MTDIQFACIGINFFAVRCRVLIVTRAVAIGLGLASTGPAFILPSRIVRSPNYGKWGQKA